MAAGGLLIREPAPVFLPVQARREPLMLEPVLFRFDLLLIGHIKKIQLVSRELVAGQRVRAGMEFGATAARR